ncbi:hypothetical protein TNCV_472381 [Trichonephila clavipes]|nr:hypothetical protein TNCV_472381 [Trichonephila clavipes]
MEFHSFWKIPGISRILPASTDIRATRSSTEGKGMNRASMTCPPLFKGYVEVFFVDVNSVMWNSPTMLVPHGVAKIEEHVLHQEVLTELVERR